MNPSYVPGYPQIHPITEYYAGCKPILCFTTPQALVSDLLYLVEHSQYKFSPLLVARDLIPIKEAFSILSKEGVLKQELTLPDNIDKYKYVLVLDLTENLKWETKRERNR